MYMIHSCNERKKYVVEWLIPSMLKQNININDVILYNDDNNDGCLMSWVKSCEYILQTKQDSMWHLQDDVVISKDFAMRTSIDYGDKIVNAFVCKKHNPSNYMCIGNQNIDKYWMSFQCMYVPSRHIEIFLDWFYKRVYQQGKYRKYYKDNRHADFFFWRAMKECCPDDIIYNMSPNLVDHIDYLLGGSVITKQKHYIREAVYWNERRGILKK